LDWIRIPKIPDLFNTNAHLCYNAENFFLNEALLHVIVVVVERAGEYSEYDDGCGFVVHNYSTRILFANRTSCGSAGLRLASCEIQ